MLVFNLAKETGWTEDYILDLPIQKFHAYTHALMNSYDKKTRYIFLEAERSDFLTKVETVEILDDELANEFLDDELFASSEEEFFQ